MGAELLPSRGTGNRERAAFVVAIPCLPFKGPDYRLYKSEPELTTVAEVDESNGEEKPEPVSEMEAPVIKGQHLQHFTSFMSWFSDILVYIFYQYVHKSVISYLRYLRSL